MKCFRNQLALLLAVLITILSVPFTALAGDSELEIEKFEAENVSVIEGTYEKGYAYNYETGKYDLEYYRYRYSSPQITVTLKNGTVIRSNGGFTYNGKWYDLRLSDDQSYNNLWGVGTHTATARIEDFETTFEVEVEETPVSKVEIESISLVEGADGRINSEYNNETGKYDLEYFLYSYEPEFTVTLKDGTVLYSKYGRLPYNGERYSLIVLDGQSYENPWGVGKHTVSASFMSVGTEFTVEITESPIASFEIEDIEIPEKQLGLYERDYYFYSNKYDIWNLPLKYTVRLKDGSVIEGSEHSLDIDGKHYFIDVSDNQANELWELGGTYIATATFAGVVYPFNIKIVENPKKVVGFQAEDSTIMYGLDDWKGNNYPISSVDDLIIARDFSLTLADGSVLHSENGSILFEDLFYTLTPQYSWNKSDVNLRELGSTFTVTATFQGFSDTFEMTVVESCIEKIDFSDVTIIENKNNNNYVYYPAYTLSFKDGSKEYYDFPKGYSLRHLAVPSLGGAGGWYYYGCFPICTDSQTETKWEAGNTYTASVSLFGFSDTVNVTVIENPVISIVPDNNTFKKDEYEPPQFSLTLKDGSVLKTANSPGGTYVNIYDEVYYIDYKFLDKYRYLGDMQLAPGSYNLPITVYALGEEYKLNISVEVLPEDEITGDLNGDGIVTLKDILISRKAVAGVSSLSEEEISRGDLNGDGVLTLKDVLIMRKMVAGVL